MCKSLKPKLVICSEARITHDINENEYNIDGYKCEVSYSHSRATGGVAIYINKKLKHKVIKSMSIENCFWYITIEIIECDMKGIFSGFYRSPDANPNESTNFINEYIETNVNINKLNVIAGDINFDFSKNSQRILAFKMMFDSCGLQIISDFFTRITNESQTQIDLILTNRPTNLLCQIENDERISDHETISLSYTTNLKISDTPETFLSWKYYNPNDLIENLRKCQWNTFEQISIDEKIDLIRSNLLASVNPMIKNIKVREKEVKLNWFDDELQALKIEKIELYKNWSTNKNDANWSCYVLKRNEYNKMIKQKKNDAIKNEFVKAGKDQKKMWKSLNKLLPSKKAKISDEIIFDDFSSTDNSEISERFNSFFIDSIRDINLQIPNADVLEFHDRTENIFKFKEVSIDEVIEASKYLTKKVNKSQVCNSSVWFDSMEYIGYFITKTINESLNTGNFPTQWKISTVTPIPKISNTNVAANFRPINELPVDEKICECLVKDQLLKYINENDLFSDKQSAFRAKHSCETVLNSLIADWKISREKGEKIVIVFLDLKRAFETVDRRIMLEKLEKLGIKDNELKWFECYLNDRKQYTKFKGVCSKEADVPIGLPQGTQLSVYLFLLYINDLPEVPDLGEIVLFADDTGLIIKHENVETAIEIANNELKKIENWFNANKLKTNVLKSKWMLIGKDTGNNLNLLNIQMENQIIERVKVMKYLGFEIDEKLDFNVQINSITKKLASKINVLYRIRDQITFDIRKIVYNSIIQPHYDYCSTLYINCTKEQIESMQKLQNRAMRYILKCEYRTPSDFMLKSLNWMNVSQRINYNVMLLVYKMKNNLVPQYLCNKIRFASEFHHRNTRNRNEIRLPDIRTENARKCLLYNGIKLFNELPTDLKNCDSINIFKKRLAMHIREY